jgi:hypothetical protein
MTILQFRRYLYIPLFLSLALLVGCSDKGVRLDGIVLTPTSTSASLTTGNGGTCTSAPCNSGDGKWNDSFITPNGSGSFTIAIQSASLIKQGDSTPSYTIFDTGDPSNPKIVSFTPGSSQQIATNPNAPADGTYDRIQYVLSYIEMLISINYQTAGKQQRRVRLYLATFTDTTLGAVDQNDILFDNTSGALNWVDPSKGLGDFFSTRSNNNTVLQLPFDDSDPNRPNQLANPNTNGGTVDDPGADPYTFTVMLDNPVVVSGDNKYDFQLNFDTAKIFFFDETNDPAITDPVASANNTNFNPVIPPKTPCTVDPSFLTNQACDGRLDAKPKAYFWPGLPAVTASGSGSAGGSTTTTTTVSTTTTT